MYVALRVYPWLRGPDEPAEAIERRWAKVQGFAEVPLTPKDFQPNELAAFASAFRGWEPPRGQGDVPLVDEQDLTRGIARDRRALARTLHGQKIQRLRPDTR